MEQPAYLYYNEKYVLPNFGLNNAGATCWANSLFQCLFGCSAFNNYILNHSTEFKNGSVGQEYIKFIIAYLNAKASSKSDNLPPNSISNIITKMITHSKKTTDKFTPKFGFFQSCAHEGITKLLETMESSKIGKLFENKYSQFYFCEHCNEIIELSKPDINYFISVYSNTKMSSSEEYSEYLNFHTEQFDTKPIFRCKNCDDYEFEYKFKNNIKNGGYDCKKCGSKISSLNDIKIDKLYDSCDCSKCGNKITSPKYLKLRKVSEILLILCDKRKENNNFWFPEKIEFRSKTETPLTYKLIGICDHSGNINENYQSSGHYTARSLRNEKFTRFNDSSYGPASCAPSSNSYMLMYHLVSPQPNIFGLTKANSICFIPEESFVEASFRTFAVLGSVVIPKLLAFE